MIAGPKERGGVWHLREYIWRERMSGWYVANEGESKGPFSSSQLRQLASDGKIQRETLICLVGTQNWVKAGQAKGLFPSPVPTAATTTPASIPVPVPQELAGQPSIAVVPPSVARPDVSVGIAPLNGSEFSSSSRSSFRWLYIAGGTLSVVVATIVATVLAMRSAENAKPDDIPGSLAVGSEPQPSGPSLETRKDIERLEEQHDELKKAVKQLRDENDRLSEEKKELQKEIEQLTVSFNELKKWQTVEVVMINPSHVAVALRTESDEALIVDRIVNGDVTPLAIAVALNAGRPFIPADPQLTREIASRFAVGQKISGDHERRVRHYWKNHKLVETPQSKPVEWVAFFNQTSRTPQIGIYVNADAEQLTYIAPSGDEKSVFRKDILAGSAAKGDIDTVIGNLDEHLLLDQCVMRVAQEIQASSSGVSTHALGIEVSVEQPERPLSSQLQDLDWPEMPNDFPVLIRGAYFYAEFLHRLRRNEKIADERSRLEALEDAKNDLEDELFKKLSSIGVIVLGRSALDELVEARECALSGASLSDYARRATLSQALIVTVTAPAYGGRYHLGLQLLDARSGKVLFAENADKIDESVQDLMWRLGGHREYHLDSGRLAVVTTKDEPPSDFHPVESPPRVPQIGPDNSRLRSPLVYVESDESDYSLQYRSLFTKRRHTAKLSDFASVKYVSTADDVPRHSLFRYLVCRAVSKTLPSGGRIKKIDGSRLVVSIGRDGGIVKGDSLRVMRYFDNDYRQIIDELQGQKSEELLPIRLKIGDVYEHYCDATVSSSGFENIWPEDYELLEGDIVIPAQRPRVSIGILPFTWKEPDRDSTAGYSLRHGFTRLDVMMQSVDELSKDLCDELSESFAGLGVSTCLPSNGPDPHGARGALPDAPQLQSIQERGATHAIYGSVQPVDHASYRVRMSIKRINQGNAGQELTDTIDFRMSAGNIPD